MQKLIAKYLAYPSFANARRLVRCWSKHPFAHAALNMLERGVLEAAHVQFEKTICFGAEFEFLAAEGR